MLKNLKNSGLGTVTFIANGVSGSQNYNGVLSEVLQGLHQALEGVAEQYGATQVLF